MSRITRSSSSVCPPVVAAIARESVAETPHIGPPFEAGAGIAHRLMTGSDDEIIAADFAFGTQAATENPDDGMEEQQRLDDSLQQVHPEIVTPDMSQLVAEYCRQLLGRKPVVSVAGNRIIGRKSPTTVGTATHSQ